ncbi:MAG TPA: hypothetical protein HA349_06965, partial [Methanotrichaceae archaeon]|nr:hypothetical protein [Methanotrichaceae archaeon]
MIKEKISIRFLGDFILFLLVLAMLLQIVFWDIRPLNYFETWLEQQYVASSVILAVISIIIIIIIRISVSIRFLWFSVLFLLVLVALLEITFLDIYGINYGIGSLDETHVNNETTFITNLGNVPKSMVFSVASAFILTLFLSVFLWMTETINQKIVIPFSTNSTSKMDGKIISDMIAAELQRIKKIHSSSRNSLYNRSERCPIPPESLVRISLEEFEITRENISNSLVNVEKLSFGGFELPIGNVLMVLNQYRPISKKGCIIRGSFQRHGSVVYTESHIKTHNNSYLHCQVCRNLGKKSGFTKDLRKSDISEVIRDLSLKITYELQKNDQNDKNDKRLFNTKSVLNNLQFWPPLAGGLVRNFVSQTAHPA